MESVGRQLLQARLRLGLALEDISAKTRINLPNLQAIEDDNLAYFDSPFFYRSFVNQFAGSVGFEQRQLLDVIKTATDQIPEPRIPGQLGSPSRPNLPSLRPQRIRKLRWMFSLVSLVIMLVACSRVYDVWQTSRSGSRSSQSRINRAVSQNRAAESGMSLPRRPMDVLPQQPGTVPLDSVPPSTIRPDTVPSSAENVPSATVRVQLSALEETWLSVAADGKKVFSGTLQAAEKKTLEGRRTAWVHTGNAGGVEVVFNGRTVGRLGREGEVRTVVFTKEGYRFLEPQEHVALASFRNGSE